MNPWMVVVLGAWTLASPWLLGAGDLTLLVWSNTLAGIALTLWGLWSIYGGESKHAKKTSKK